MLLHFTSNPPPHTHTEGYFLSSCAWGFRFTYIMSGFWNGLWKNKPTTKNQPKYKMGSKIQLANTILFLKKHVNMNKTVQANQPIKNQTICPVFKWSRVYLTTWGLIHNAHLRKFLIFFQNLRLQNNTWRLFLGDFLGLNF